MKKIFALVLFLSCLILAGCPPKKTVKTTEQPGQIEQQQREISQKETPERDTTRWIRPDEKITEERLAKVETKEEIPSFTEERGIFKDINFDYDRYDIRPDAQPVLQEIASWLVKNPSAKILIEGHCDERGTSEYNLALGDRRAKAARDYLVALGVAPARIEMISYGEEKPLCTEQTEDCWAKNRRAHFVVIRETQR